MIILKNLKYLITITPIDWWIRLNNERFFSINLFIYNILRCLLPMRYRSSKAILIVAVAYLAVIFALASGVFNAIIEGGRQGAASFILPTRSVQTIGETIVTTMILFMGMVGVFLVYRSGKATTLKTREALLASGFAVTGMALILGFRLIDFKV